MFHRGTERERRNGVSGVRSECHREQEKKGDSECP